MKRILNLFILLLAVSGISSCVQEDPFFDPEDSENVIEFLSAGNVQSPATAPYPLFINSYAAADEVEMPIVVSYSGADVAPTDITVTIGAGTQSVLDVYNEAQETEYELLPANLYTLPATVTIPRGERRATYIVKLKTNQFDFTKSYALPLTITETSSGIISGNFSTAVFAVGAKNKYDGLYEVTGTMVDRINPAFVGEYPLTVELRTVTLTTNSYYDHDNDLAGHLFDTGAGLSYFGSFAPIFHFDANNNIVNVTNVFGNPAPGATARAGKLETTGINKVTFKADGTPDKMEVTYTMVQAGADRTTWTETWTYIGPR